jgi:hypothetical protein
MRIRIQPNISRLIRIRIQVAIECRSGSGSRHPYKKVFVIFTVLGDYKSFSSKKHEKLRTYMSKLKTLDPDPHFEYGSEA